MSESWQLGMCSKCGGDLYPDVIDQDVWRCLQCGLRFMPKELAESLMAGQARSGNHHGQNDYDGALRPRDFNVAFYRDGLRKRGAKRQDRDGV